MKMIQSFSVDHTKIVPGIFTSRVDKIGESSVTTYDIRLKKPNREPVIDMPALHTIEHLGATFLRSTEERDSIVYFGPMGCRTGCYLVVFGDLRSEDIFPLVCDMCDFILNYEGEIPGATPVECGNYSEQNLNMAKYYIKNYKESLIKNRRFTYPE